MQESIELKLFVKRFLIKGDCQMILEVDQLDMRINQLKEELIQIAGETGLNSSHTLCCSQELDQLIILKMKNQKRKMKRDGCDRSKA